MPLEPAQADAMLDRLTAQHGELMGSAALGRCLGYRTPRAFQVALQRRRLPIATFELAGRRGRYAYTFEVAAWLAALDADPGAPAGADRTTAPEVHRPET